MQRSNPNDDPADKLANIMRLSMRDVQRKVKRRVQLPYIAVAAIDFGTTFSGFAFSFKKHQEEIRMNKNWKGQAGVASYKAPTCILLNLEGQFEAFGYEAQHKYSQRSQKDSQDCAYFENFKMQLHNNEIIDSSTNLKATNGKEHNALKIFSMALGFLKETLIAQISTDMDTQETSSMIKWVLTVPAIWNDRSKQFMREAALEARLIDSMDSSQLVIALEPEAASLFCRLIYYKESKSITEKHSPHAKLRAGSKYLVIDAGGGTLDVTAHELLPHNRVKELHHATGGALGGNQVNDKFIELMETILGKEFITDLRNTSPAEWLDFMLKFENSKKTCESTINIQMSFNFAMKYSAFSNKKPEDISHPHAKFDNGFLCITDDGTQSLFQQPIDDIIEHVETLLKDEKLDEIKFFMLVGGFNQSSRLQEAIKTKFEGKVEVVIPDECSIAVLKGAVLFGHDPTLIESRISTNTYGVEVFETFDPSRHPSEKKTQIGGHEICKDIFSTFIKAGEEVQEGETKTLTYRPSFEEQVKVSLSILITEKPEVDYTTEDGVKHHGELSVDWQGTGLERQVEVSMTFGGTEVYVEAVTQPGNISANTRLNFYV